MNAFLNPASLDWDHFIKQSFGSLRCTSPKVTLTTFCAHKLSRTCQAEAFGSCFMGFYFIFSFSWLSRHNFTPLTQNSAGNRFHPRMIDSYKMSKLATVSAFTSF
jgi:hypothetical protein